MNNRKWTAWEVSEATGNTYDSVIGWINRNGHSAVDGMTIEMILAYLKAPKRDKRNIDNDAVEDLREILRLLNVSTQ